MKLGFNRNPKSSYVLLDLVSKDLEIYQYL